MLHQFHVIAKFSIYWANEKIVGKSCTSFAYVQALEGIWIWTLKWIYWEIS